MRGEGGGRGRPLNLVQTAGSPGCSPGATCSFVSKETKSCRSGRDLQISSGTGMSRVKMRIFGCRASNVPFKKCHTTQGSAGFYYLPVLVFADESTNKNVRRC